MISIRGGMGLGDALYLQSVARHLVEQGHEVEACTPYGDVFRPLGDKVRVSPFRRNNIDRLAHYSRRRHARDTTQWDDICIEAGIPRTTDLRLDWKLADRKWLDHKRWGPVVLVKMACHPFDRKDGWGVEFLPQCESIQSIIDVLGKHFVIVQIGSGVPAYQYRGIDVDLVNKTSVADLIDLASISGALVGQCSFLIPLAESLNKPALLVWAMAHEQSRHEVVRWLTPAKVLHKPSCRFIYDDTDAAAIARAADALCEHIGSQKAA
jgi:hypothetical protein